MLVKLYTQFQPKRELDEHTVVETRIKTPVRAINLVMLFTFYGGDEKSNVPVDMASVPCQPRIGNSTRYPASRALGTPITLKMTC